MNVRDDAMPRPADPPPGLVGSPRPVAVIDMGASALRLVIAETGAGGSYRIIEEASRRRLPIRLAVVKFNPSRRLYERLGFRVTHEDDRKVYMTRDPDPPSGIGS